MWSKIPFFSATISIPLLIGCMSSNEPEAFQTAPPASKSAAELAPIASWEIHDGFESGILDPHWTPYPLSIGSITTGQAHNGTHSFQVTYSDFKYTFDHPIKEGKISWWYLEGTGTPWTYLYILTDTSHANLGDYNVHMVTNFPDTYSFYYYSVGYKYGVPRLPGWRKFETDIHNGKVSISVDGQEGISVKVGKPVLAFQVAGAVIDDLKAKSN
jgi:hypothetical protein